MALPILLLFQLNGAVAFADQELTYDNIVLSVSSMPLSVFASTVEEGMSVSIEVDEAIEDFLIDGRFDGTIDYLLNELNSRYGIDHSVSDNVYKLWRDTSFASQASYQFQLSDMDLVSFLSYLSEAAGYQLVADTSIKITIDGAFNGTLKDTINALSHQYPVLFYISEDTISVVPESSFVKSEVVLTDDNYSPDAFLTDLRTKIPPGNFVNREDNQLIVGGHPDFVRRTELELQVDMSNAAILIPELLTTKLPVVTVSDNETRVGLSVSGQPDNSAASAPLVLINQQDAILSDPNADIALTPEAGAEIVVNQKKEAEIVVTSNQEAEVTVTNEQDTEVSISPAQKTEITGALEQETEVAETLEVEAEFAATPAQETEIVEALEQGAEVVATPAQETDIAETVEQDAEVVVTPAQQTDIAETVEQGAEDAVMPEPDAELMANPEQEVVDKATSENSKSVGAVDQIPGFY